jgi:hypothetical protein
MNLEFIMLAIRHSGLQFNSIKSSAISFLPLK